MLAMLFRSIVVLLAGRLAYADFHFLNCVSSGSTTTTIPANPTIAVPTSDLSSCTGILGDRMVLLENLTQPIGQGAVFSFNGFCDTRRLDVYTASSDLLGIFLSGGDGTLLGECSPTNPSKNYSCVSPSLGSLDCIDSWMCFTGICEAARQGINTQPFSPLLPTTPVASSTGPSSNTGAGMQSSSNISFSGAAALPTTSTEGENDNLSPNNKSANGSSKKSVIVAAVLGVICLCLGTGIAFLIWHRRRRAQETARVAADLPPTEQYSCRSVVTPVLTAGTLGRRPTPFLVTQTSPSATTSEKALGISSTVLWMPGPSSGTVREEVREVTVPVRPVGPRRSSVESWRTDAQPPSYVRGSGVGE